MKSLFQKKIIPETREVPPQVVAQIVHRFMVKVQAYTDQMISKKRAELEEKGGEDEALLAKLDDWLTYHRFNTVALEEIEKGDLDEWFRTLFSGHPPSDRP